MRERRIVVPSCSLGWAGLCESVLPAASGLAWAAGGLVRKAPVMATATAWGVGAQGPG